MGKVLCRLNFRFMWFSQNKRQTKGNLKIRGLKYVYRGFYFLCNYGVSVKQRFWITAFSLELVIFPFKSPINSTMFLWTNECFSKVFFYIPTACAHKYWCPNICWAKRVFAEVWKKVFVEKPCLTVFYQSCVEPVWCERFRII